MPLSGLDEWGFSYCVVSSLQRDVCIYIYRVGNEGGGRKRERFHSFVCMCIHIQKYMYSYVYMNKGCRLNICGKSA